MTECRTTSHFESPNQPKTQLNFGGWLFELTPQFFFSFFLLDLSFEGKVEKEGKEGKRKEKEGKEGKEGERERKEKGKRERERKEKGKRKRKEKKDGKEGSEGFCAELWN